jgi:hypothetical protein
MSSTTQTAQEGDIGTIIRVQVGTRVNGVFIPKDISTASVKKLVFHKPGSGSFTKTAEFTTDGTDGNIEWATVTGDLTPWGTYQVQPDLVIPGFTGRGKRATFEVLKNL